MITVLLTGEVPAFTPSGSWLLIGSIVGAVAAFAYRGIASGPDALADAAYDDRISTPYPPRPSGLVEHEVCEADGCAEVICYCDTESPCLRTVDRGCAHPGAVVCDLHRAECMDCRLDAMCDAGLLR